MTRTDWWIGIALVLLALVIQTAILLRQFDDIRAEYKPQMRPLAALIP